MEVKIGISDVPREVTVETSATADEVVANLRTAIEGGGLLELVDDKGRRVLVPAAKIGYLDLGSPSARTVGFGAV